jgi:diguanylate cyclase (GGDEF)-like protein
MNKVIKALWDKLKLEDKILVLVIIVGSAACAFAGFTTIWEGLGGIASYTAFAFSIILIILGILMLCSRWGNTVCIVMVFLFNCILFPLLFLLCGGVDTGTICFIVLGGFLSGVLLKGKMRGISMITGLTFQSAAIWVHYVYGDYLFDGSDMDRVSRYADFNFSLVISSLALFLVTMITVDEYKRQTKRNQELVEQLKDVLKQDALTGLYNRRKLYETLEKMYPQLGDVHSEKLRKYFLVMYDIDHFKKLNDTYGHQFGDKVLRTVSGILQLKISDSAGEFVSRYGGEEFVCVMRAGSLEEATARAEEKRREIERIHWTDSEDLVVTISGGVTCCGRYKTMDEALKTVDDLLYEAKHTGRNRIVSR